MTENGLDQELFPMQFTQALKLAVKARAIELAMERWHVAQHPLNQYPEGHDHYRPMPPKPDYEEGLRLRREASLMLAEFAAPHKGGPRVGMDLLWELGPHLIYPVRVARVKDARYYNVERLDDPDPGPMYKRKAWYQPWASHGKIHAIRHS